MKHDGGWRRDASRYLFRSPWFQLRQDEVTLPGGEAITYNVVEHPGYAMVVPLLADGRVLLERVYRYTVQETCLECPSGGLEDETPEACGRRELLEETGHRAAAMRPLGSFFGSNGISDERLHLFLATGVERAAEPRRDPTEQMELERVPLERAVAMAIRGEVADAPSALGLLLAERALRAGAAG